MNNSSKSIVVFGETLIDDFVDEQIVGGAPFNLARNVAAFGLPLVMFTGIGNAHDGMPVVVEHLLHWLTHAGRPVLGIDSATNAAAPAGAA